MRRRFAYRAKFQKLFNDQRKIRTLAIKIYDKSAQKIHGRVLVPSADVKAYDFLGFVEYFFSEALHDNFPVTLYWQTN